MAAPFPGFRDRDCRYYVRFGSARHTWEVCDRTDAADVVTYSEQERAERRALVRSGRTLWGYRSPEQRDEDFRQRQAERLARKFHS